jgi:hypothetical protein
MQGIESKDTIGSEHEYIYIYIPFYNKMNMNISKESYHIQKDLESLMCTLAFELFIVSGPSELKTNDPWWSEVARVDFFSLSLRATCRKGHFM